MDEEDHETSAEGSRQATERDTLKIMAPPPGIEELRKALEHVRALPLGLGEVERIAGDPETTVLMRLRCVEDRATPPASADELAYAVVEVIERSIGRLYSPSREIAEAAFGMNELRGGGRKTRFEAARVVAEETGVPGDFGKTVLPNVINALAGEVRKFEVKARGAAVRRRVDPAVQRQLAATVEQAKSHLPGLSLNLPRLNVSATVHRRPLTWDVVDGKPVSLLQRWFAEVPDSNLAVVLGPFGSGKTDALVSFTDCLRASAADQLTMFALYRDVAPDDSQGVGQSIHDRLLELYKLDAPEFQQRVAEQLAEAAIVIDGFDEVWGSKHRSSPDLTHLRSLLDVNARVVVAARRHFDMAADPFIGQLLDPALLAQTGAKQPLVIELKSPAFDEVRSALSAAQSEQATLVLEYLSRFSPEEVEHLFRPLLLQMLLLVTDNLPQEPTAISVATLYRRYTNNVLQRDYSQHLSEIPPDAKRLILIAAAGDVLKSGRSGDSAHHPVAFAQCSYDNVSLRVLEVLDKFGLADPSKDRTRDFAHTNHLLRPVYAEAWDSYVGRPFNFSHPTFFELFCAEYLLSRLSDKRSLELPDTDFVESLFDSLVPYFLAAYATQAVHALLRQLVSRDTIGFCECALCLRLLEDDPELPDVMQRIPESYWTACRQNENRTPSFFLKKMIKYQLILKEHSDERALEYVQLLRDSERVEHRDLEANLFATRSSREVYLLTRLANKNLEAARAVTIFRLGQFGGDRTLDVLTNYPESDLSEGTVFVLHEAINKIRERV
jgi:hypothetical protein